ncbi:hypothetical protein [Acidaminococcus sp. LBK-2]|uniref:hypothetical protein n=1 Tax=Acidaminococcus sp. LBK-2 TaxID=3456956 RepID=UPI003FA43610
MMEIIFPGKMEPSKASTAKTSMKMVWGTFASVCGRDPETFDALEDTDSQHFQDHYGIRVLKGTYSVFLYFRSCESRNPAR